MPGFTDLGVCTPVTAFPAVKRVVHQMITSLVAFLISLRATDLAPAGVTDRVPPAHAVTGPAVVPAGTSTQVFAITILIAVSPSRWTCRHALAGKTEVVGISTGTVAGPTVLGAF